MTTTIPLAATTKEQLSARLRAFKEQFHAEGIGFGVWKDGAAQWFCRFGDSQGGAPLAPPGIPETSYEIVSNAAAHWCWLDERSEWHGGTAFLALFPPSEPVPATDELRQMSVSLAGIMESATKNGPLSHKVQASQVIDSYQHIMLVVDREGRLVAHNETARDKLSQLLGTPMNIGKSLKERLGSSLLDAFNKRLEAALQGRSISVCRELPSLKPGEKRRAYEFAYSPVKSGENEVTAVCITCQDITPRRDACREMEEQALVTKILQEHSSDFVAVWSARSEVFTYVSPSFESVMGIPVEKAVGGDLSQLVAAEDVRFLSKIMRKGADTPEFSALLEFRAINSTGDLIDLEAICRHWSEGDEEGVLINARNISERKAQEQNLHLLNRAVESVQSGIVIFDENQIVRFANGPLVELLGGTSGDFTGKALLNAALVPAQSQDRGKVNRAIAAGDGKPVVFRCKRSNGKNFWCEGAFSSVPAANGEGTHTVGVFADVSKRIRDQKRLKESENRYHGIFQNSSDSLFTVDCRANGAFVFTDMNPSLMRNFGMAPERILGKASDELLPSDVNERLTTHLRTVTSTHKQVEFEDTFGSGARQTTWHVTLIPLQDNRNQVKRILGNARDVTEHRAATTLERDRRKVLECIVQRRGIQDTLLNIIMLVQGQVKDAECFISLEEESLSSASLMTFHDPTWDEEISGEDSLELLKPVDLEEYSDDEVSSVYITENLFKKEVLGQLGGYTKKQRDPHDFSMPVQNQEGLELGHLRLQFAAPRELTAREHTACETACQLAAVALEQLQLSKRLEIQARHDALTGLPNRYLGEDRLRQALVSGKMHKETVAFLCLDLDGFKRVKDTFGHTVGDKVLQEVARRLETSLRPHDTLCRIGGDEFTLVMSGNPEPEDALNKGESLRENFSSPFVVEEREIFLSISIGVAMFPDDGDSVETLRRNADVALFQAKTTGRNRVHFYDEHTHTAILRKHRLEEHLRKAIEREEIEVHYHPQVYMDSGDISGFEALMRWESRTDGKVSPVDFIPLLEETGMIVEFGEHILRKACEQVANWNWQVGRLYTIGVNVSAVQLARPDFVPMVLRVLRETGLEPSCLELEVTESIFVDDFEESISRLKELREARVRIALDDFGTGYSSLSYLQRLPFDCIKIDQSFVRSLNHAGEVRKKAGALINSIIFLAKSLGLSTIAEGIENERQLAFLRQANCEHGQGYYFSKPASARLIETKL